MIYLLLFVEFFQIGAFTFGGGYAMISLIRERMLAHGWLTETELLNMIAVAESTPGPIAINMATFVGASQGGLFGSIVATLGVVMPSFLIILLIAAILKNLLKYDSVQAFLGANQPSSRMVGDWLSSMKAKPSTAHTPSPISHAPSTSSSVEVVPSV